MLVPWNSVSDKEEVTEDRRANMYRCSKKVDIVKFFDQIQSVAGSGVVIRCVVCSFVYCYGQASNRIVRIGRELKSC